MSTNYPLALDTASNLPSTITDGVATLGVHADYHNNANLAILAIENELGISPKGSYASVVLRLNDTTVKTPGTGSQVIKPSLDERAVIYRPFSDTQTNKLVEYQNAAGSATLASVDKVGNADFASYKVAGVALASANLSDTANLARITTTNTFTQGQTISANSGLILSGNGGKTTLSLTNTGANTGMTIGGDVTLYRFAADVLATDDTLLFPQAVAATVVLKSTVAGTLAHQVKAGGAHEWADGTGAVDTNWYRRGAAKIGSDFTVDIALDIVARSGATAQTRIGAYGPGNEAAIQLGSASPFTLYLSAANTGRTTGTISANALQINGTALASSHLSDGTSIAMLAGPTFTGTGASSPKSTTAAVDDNSTKIATTAYVIAQAATGIGDNPKMNGAVALGTSTHWARADHVHATDSTLAPLASPALTGTPTAPTAAALTNNGQVATTSYVDSAVASGMPSGTIVSFAGAAAPSGWMICDGSSQLRASFANLFTALGGASSPYGLPDGTHFSLPDLRGRTVYGLGTHVDVNALAKNEGQGLANRTPKHYHGTGTLNITSSGAHGHTFTGTAGTTGNESVGHVHYLGSATGSVGPLGDQYTATTNTTAGGSHGHSLYGGVRGSGAYTQVDMGLDYNLFESLAQGGSVVANTHTHPATEFAGYTSGQHALHTHGYTPAGGVSGTDKHTHLAADFAGFVGTTAANPAEAGGFLVLNYIIKT